MPSSPCIFLIDDRPITPNAVGGGSSVLYSHLELLGNSGCEVVLVILSDDHTPKRFNEFKNNQPDVWETIRNWYVSEHTIKVSQSIRRDTRLQRFASCLWCPTYHIFGPPASHSGTLTALRQIIADVTPQIIWAEHLLPATIAHQVAENLPVIYSHTDWKWRIKSHRIGPKARRWRSRLNFWLTKRHEESLVRQVAGCVSASVTEAEEICKLGARNVCYLPITYTAVNPPAANTLHSPPRIVHLGGMQTTANRMGLERFLDVTWPILTQKLSDRPELWVIGSLAGAPDTLLAKLEQVGAVCTGFVEDLSTVLRPYDLHIVPWEHNTGTRTRIPVILNHSQVLVSTRAAAACLPELKHNENSMLVDDLIYMANCILLLLSNDPLRQRVGNAGRLLFLNHFTQAAIQPRFNAFINQY